MVKGRSLRERSRSMAQRPGQTTLMRALTVSRAVLEGRFSGVLNTDCNGEIWPIFEEPVYRVCAVTR